MARHEPVEVTVALSVVKKFTDNQNTLYYQLQGDDSVVSPTLSQSWNEKDWEDFLFHTGDGYDIEITELPVSTE